MDELEVARFSSLPEAEAVAALLRTHGIAARLPDSQTLGAAAYMQTALGGVRVVVPDYQVMEARELVRRARAGEFAEALDEDDVDDVGDAHGPRGALTAFRSWARLIVVVLFAAPLAMCVAAAALD